MAKSRSILILKTDSCNQCMSCSKVNLSNRNWAFFDVIVILGYVEEDVCDECLRKIFNEQFPQEQLLNNEQIKRIVLKKFLLRR